MSWQAPQARIRRMTEADLARVVEIAAILPEAPRWPPAVYVAAMNEENSLRRIALVVVDAESDAPRGFAIASVLAPEAELETIAVAPQFRRLGLGRLLLGALAAELRKAQVTELILEVRASNRAAVGFYRGQGFSESGRRARYYADPEEDALLMRLNLAEALR